MMIHEVEKLITISIVIYDKLDRDIYTVIVLVVSDSSSCLCSCVLCLC
jgi:hypothetical protein